MNDLMQKRFKVIADFPGSPFKVGDVYNKIAFIIDPEKYPHLFKELQWWEERSLDELPEYVLNEATGGVEKVTWELNGNRMRVRNEDGYIAIHLHYTPATEEEYNSYIKTKKQIKL